MRITFVRDTENYASWHRTLTLSGDRGELEVALCIASPQRGEKIALRHGLKRTDVKRLAEGLTSWLASPESFPECVEPGCGAPAIEDSDYCGGHQD